MKANDEPCKLGPHTVEESSDDGRTWAESVPWPTLDVLRTTEGIE